MFSSKKSKQQTVNTVDSLLTTYLQTSDKTIRKSQEKALRKGKKSNASSSHEATKILRTNAQLGNFNKTKSDLKKSKTKERKIRNKEMKKHNLINEKIIRQSKLDNGDAETVGKLINDKVSKITRMDTYLKNDDELVDLQSSVLEMSSKENTKSVLRQLKDRNHLSTKRRNAKLDSFNDKIAKGYIAVNGLTPGLAQPGDDDSDSDSDGDDDDKADFSNFKDDFDDFN